MPPSVRDAHRHPRRLCVQGAVWHIIRTVVALRPLAVGGQMGNLCAPLKAPGVYQIARRIVHVSGKQKGAATSFHAERMSPGALACHVRFPRGRTPSMR